ncbi:hypothetical protein AB0L06_14935 [Spirillospora sp. NPDC052269]
MNDETGTETGTAAAVRHARFGALPERVALKDTVEEKPVASPNPMADVYDPDGLGVRFSCLAADFGV